MSSPRPPRQADAQSLSIDIHSDLSTTTLILKGRIGGALSAAERDRVLDAAEAAVHTGGVLLVDFSGVSEATGEGLRRLLLLARRVRSQGGTIMAQGASDELLAVAEASGFLDLFGQVAPLQGSAPRQAIRAQTDFYPTHSFEGFDLRPGFPMPLGATLLPQGVNFSVYSRNATQCWLELFEPDAVESFASIPFPPEFRVGDVHAMTVFHLGAEDFEYGFRMDGPFEPKEGHRFNREKVLLDPAARAVCWRPTWGERDDRIVSPRGRIVSEDFDWQDDRPLQIPLQDLVVYEAHVRGFTRHPTSGVRFPGTYAGLKEKIPYLVELGVNCVELLPIFEFDETEVDRVNPLTGEPLVNYWGYSTLGFFAPKASYAATGRFHLQADEFKSLVKELHRNGIEVMLDVVFNHTSEGNENGPTLSFRGLDNSVYYMLTPDGNYFNFSGCGNTINCNHPVVRDFVLNCLRHWVAQYHIDGFRFDLASILGRAPDGTPLTNPPLLESLALDPVLGRTKLIAEAWDAGGLYQVGHFPAYGRWGEWNGKYRDCIRKFLKGDMGQVGEISQRLAGSPDLYYYRGPSASINFVTCHDGFTLADVVSYNDKHNEANGESNRDGDNGNHSWNCGAEGPTDDPEILALRRRQTKNALSMLFLSQGVPMLLMGDEVGRSQLGNNNTYCQDNELNWLNWSLKTKNAELFRYCRALIAFRKTHPVLRRAHFPGNEGHENGTLEISWHGVHAWRPDWSGTSRVLAFQACLRGAEESDVIYAALNMYWEALPFELPATDEGRRWHIFANTGIEPPGDVFPLGEEPILENQREIEVGGRSVVILVAR